MCVFVGFNNKVMYMWVFKKINDWLILKLDMLYDIFFMSSDLVCLLFLVCFKGYFGENCEIECFFLYYGWKCL